MGCATLGIHHFVHAAHRPPEAEIFFLLLDQTVKNAQAGQGSNFSIPHFPYLRTNRFWNEFIKISHAQDPLGLEAMRQLDLKARMNEIRNLSDEDIESLTAQLAKPPLSLSISTKEELILKLQTYSKIFLEEEKRQSGFYDAFETAFKKTPREYSTLRRLIGFYPLFSIPVILGTRQAHEKFLKWQTSSVDKLPLSGTLRNFSSSQENPPSQKISQIFSVHRQEPQGILKLTNEEIQKIIAAFAPDYVQDTVGDYDRFGEVIWQNNKVTIDGTKPTVYYYLSYALMKNKPVVQLNYVIWYSARDGANSPWLERGPLDGITVRITLDEAGSAIMMDTMNNCGCYHFFVPRRDKIKKASRILSLQNLLFQPGSRKIIPRKNYRSE